MHPVLVLKRAIPLFCLLSIVLLIGVRVSSAESTPNTAKAPTTIVVNTTEDLATSSNFHRETCGYASGAIFTIPADGKCTLRRAILEAGVRPDADRPITIEFNIPTTDSNYDAALKIWEVQIDESYIWEIDRRFVTEDGGQVTIDGDTQPGGRTTGPKIMINTNRDNLPTFGRSLEVRTANNTIRNLGFHGGGQIILYADNNLVEHVWMGLTNDGTALKLASTATSQAQRSMARGGIIMPNEASDDNIIRHNRIIGAFERAIRVTSGGDNNVIEDNFIGMNASGIVDISTDTVDCTRGVSYDSSLWYGGRGIQILGTNNTIHRNRIAGLNSTQSTNDTPPIAMEIYGIENDIRNNIVGIDGTGSKVGSCGQGLLFGGSDSVVTENTFQFVRNGFEPTDVGSEFDAAILTQSFSTQGSAKPWLKVWNNIIDGGDNDESTYYTYRFASPGVPDALRMFSPAKVTSINGTTISGTQGDDSPMGHSSACANCTIYLYADDTDDRVEAFELLGTATANASGNWTTTISRPLADGEGLRTQSMSNAANVIHIYGANTTSELSDDLYVIVPEISFVKTTYQVAESVGDVAIQIKLSQASTGPVTVEYSTIGDSATLNVDYVGNSGALEFAPGELTKTVIVKILEDTIDEPNERLGFRIGNQIGATLAVPNTAIITIVDNDGTVVPPPTGGSKVYLPVLVR